MLTVKCALCQGRGYTECECARQIEGGGERENGLIEYAGEGCGGGEGAELSFEGGDPACERCGGSGRLICPGCMGGGIVDMPAFG